jgi:putative transposase
MSQSLSSLHIHLVFSTKNRRNFIDDAIRVSLHSYMAAVLNKRGCHPVMINSTEDHVHLLFNLSRAISVSQAVEEVKKTSSKWIKTKDDRYDSFAWQAGYGAFSVSESNVASVKEYIAHQHEHHKKLTFQEEYRLFLEKHGIG